MNDIQASAAETNLDANWLVPCGRGNITVSNEARHVPFQVPPTKALLRFYGPDSTTFGELWLDENGVFHFAGDASETAKILFAELKRLSGK